MQILNLTPENDYRPLYSHDIDIEIKKSIFKGGEPHLKIVNPPEDIKSEVTIVCRYSSFIDIAYLLEAVDALRQINPKIILNLFIPYFPGARQDQVMNYGEPLTVKIMATLVNSMGFSRVYVIDPHSIVTTVLIDNLKVINNYKFVQDVLQKLDLENVAIVSPDAGANKKVYALAKHIKAKEIIFCDKIRNLDGGALMYFKVNTEFAPGTNCVIVDDICDGGRTFIHLSEVLRAKGANKIILIVTHGIFSYGLDVLSDIDHIFCLDTWPNGLANTDRFTQIKFSSYVDIS
jgi:ribose-phosphate pyrophosphokinase